MITPIGLTIPTCECWNKRPKAMNDAVDRISSMLMLEALADADAISLCPAARDYYIAAIVFTMVSALVVKRRDDKDYRKNPIASYRQEFENVYDRLRPLVMQRIDYCDSVIDSAEVGK